MVGAGAPQLPIDILFPRFSVLIVSVIDLATVQRIHPLTFHHVSGDPCGTGCRRSNDTVVRFVGHTDNTIIVPTAGTTGTALRPCTWADDVNDRPELVATTPRMAILTSTSGRRRVTLGRGNRMLWRANNHDAVIVAFHNAVLQRNWFQFFIPLPLVLVQHDNVILVRQPRLHRHPAQEELIITN